MIIVPYHGLHFYDLETSWIAKCICSSNDSVIYDFFGTLPPIIAPMDQESTMVQNPPIMESKLVPNLVFPTFWSEFKEDKIEKRIYFNDNFEKHYICYVLM